MVTMKKALKIFSGIVAAAAIALWLVFYLTSGLSETAKAFFDAVRESDLTTARSYLAKDFSDNTDDTALLKFISDHSLNTSFEISWSERRIDGGVGQLEGTLTTEDAKVTPLRLTFVKENSTWKIYNIYKSPSGITSSGHQYDVPETSDQVKLVKATTSNFITSLKQKDMNHFRENISDLWRKQTTTQELNQAFQSIIDLDINWDILDTHDPVILPKPSIEQDGVLVIRAVYRTTPEINFTLEYVYEYTDWKLLGLNIKIETE
jgi:hypothetical protein